MGKVVTARFKGEDGSMGYTHGQIYQLVIDGNNVVRPFPCPYQSIESFLDNWTL